jgi:hypothetical protein
MYQALRSLNVATESIVYPGQFHAFTRSSFIRDRYQRDLAWYDKYLMKNSQRKLIQPINDGDVAQLHQTRFLT